MLQDFNDEKTHTIWQRSHFVVQALPWQMLLYVALLLAEDTAVHLASQTDMTQHTGDQEPRQPEATVTGIPTSSVDHLHSADN